MKKTLLLFTFSMLLISACSGSAEPTLLPAPPSPVVTSTPLPEETPEQPDPIIPLPAEPLVERAVLDLAARLSIPVDEINLINVAAVEWPDASLGCPEEGLAYAQVITPGFWIVLEVSGDPYTYHSGFDEPFLCTTNTSGIPPGKITDPTVKDGGPNETRDDDVIIAPPSDRK